MKKTIFFIFFLVVSLVVWAEYNVGSKVITLRDQSRYRNIITNVYYPATVTGTDVPIANDSTKFPVVSFGHGFVMSSLAYQWLAQSLAAAGYIVGFPATEEGVPNHAEFGKDELFVARRLRDLGDSSSSFLYNRTNGYTAVGGHSMGGGASFLAVNGALDITTLFNFSAAETFPLYGVVASEAAKNIMRPALIFCGTKDCIAPSATNSGLMYKNLKSEYKFYVNIINASHCQFGDPNKTVCEIGELLACPGSAYVSVANQQSIVLAYLKPWLDFWLKKNCNAMSTFYNNATANLSKADTLQSKIIDCSALNLTTGIRQNKILKAFIFPNPSTGKFTLSISEAYQNATIMVYDMIGNVVDVRTVSGLNTISLDYTSLPKGDYLLQFNTEKGNYSSRIIFE
jgi:pimeloyl-ACP methyl ester carboxylesterase